MSGESRTDPNKDPRDRPYGQSDDDQTAKSTEIIPPEVLDAALRSLGLDPRNPASAQKALEFTLTMFGGPLPPPNILAEYGKIFPGLAEKLVVWVEQQRDFRQSKLRRGCTMSGGRIAWIVANI
jgi:hypothetical protein